MAECVRAYVRVLVGTCVLACPCVCVCVRFSLRVVMGAFVCVCLAVCECTVRDARLARH